MSAYSIIPPSATTYRAGMVNVQLGSPLKAARSMPQPSSTARSSSEIFQRRPKACATLPPASTRLANEPVASLRLQAVARRLLRDDDQRSAEAAHVVRGGLDRAEVDVAVRAPSPPVEHEDDRAATQRLALGERPAVAVTQLESG